mmetsp:Transcript_2079/g.6584  ORF Transcript_2079/g.6584 Transcript_2079/m.6584 type:complete len:250 (+) Transcript_2079:1009-1758(+)
MHAGVLLGHENGHRTIDHVALRPAKHLGGRHVEVQNQSLLVDDHDRVDHAVEQLELALRGLGGRLVAHRAAVDAKHAALAVLHGGAQMTVLAQRDLVAVLVLVLELHAAAELALYLALQLVQRRSARDTQRLRLTLVHALARDLATLAAAAAARAPRVAAATAAAAVYTVRVATAAAAVLLEELSDQVDESLSMTQTRHTERNQVVTAQIGELCSRNAVLQELDLVLLELDEIEPQGDLTDRPFQGGFL